MNSSHLKAVYLMYVRKQINNQWLQVSKKDEYLFDDLADMLEAKQMDPDDYMAYHFKYANGYRSPKYICSPTAIHKYEIHQKMKGKYSTPEYYVDGDDFYVNATRKKYALSQVNSGSSQDPDANFALTLAEQAHNDWAVKVDAQLWEAAEYTVCKFLYKNKTVPTNLLSLLGRCRKEKDETKTQQGE